MLTVLQSSLIYDQEIQNQIQNKLRMKTINYASFKLKEKATRNVKKKIEDKVYMIIR